MSLRPQARGRRRLWLIAACCLASFAGGVVVSQPLLAGRFDPYKKLSVFTKVLSYIENNYVENVSESDLMFGAARGLTDVLDPHSRFMDPEEYDRLKRETEGDTEITGIGIDLERRKRGLVVVSPIEGSPAYKAGVEPGDVIKKIDGTDTDSLEWEDAVGRIQGPAGSEVVLVVERRGKPLTFRIRRERFEVRSVEGRAARGRLRLRQDPHLLVQHRQQAAGGAGGREEEERGQGRAARADPGPAPQPGRPARPGRAGGRSLPRRGPDRAHRGQGRAGDGPADGPQPRQLDRASRWWCWWTAPPPRRRRSSPAPCRTTSAR